MAKKRLDQERDSSSAQRIMKAGRAALAVGAGAALFSRTKLSAKLVNEIIPAVGSTKKTFTKELLGKKRTAMSLYEAFNKSVGMDGSEFKKALEARKNINYKINTSTSKTFLGARKHSQQLLNNELYKQAQEDLYRKTVAGAINNVSKQFGDKYSKNVYSQVVESAMAKMDKISSNNEFSTKFIEETVSKLNIDKDDLNVMLSMTNAAKKNNYDDAAIAAHVKKFLPMREELEKYSKENLKKKTNENKFIDKLLGSKPLTVKEFQERASELVEDLDPEHYAEEVTDKFSKFKGAKKETVYNALNDLNEINKHGEFDNVIFDPNLRIRKDGTIIDATDTMKIVNGITDWFSSTLPGKVLFKGIDKKQASEAPLFALLQQGKKSRMAFLDGADDAVLQKPKMYVDGKVFDIKEGADGYHLGEELLDNVFLRSNKHGSYSTVNKNMLGSDRLEPSSSTNPLMQLLDINQSGDPGPIARTKEFFGKFKNDNWERNVINRIQARMNSDTSLFEEINQYAEANNISYVDAMARMHEDNKIMNDLFSNKASAVNLSQDTVTKMINYLDSVEGDESILKAVDRAKELLEMALNSDSPEQTIKQVSQMKNAIHSSSLRGMVSRYRSNTQDFMNSISIEHMDGIKIPIMEVDLGGTNTVNVGGIIRKELIKEASSDRTVANIIKQSGVLTDQELEAFTLLEHWNMFENATKASGEFNIELSDIFRAGGSLEKYEEMLANNPALLNEFNIVTQGMKTDYGVFHKGNLSGINEKYYSEYGDYEVIQKTKWFNGRNIIEALNDSTKMKAMFAELNAGRNDLANATNLTENIQYMINRLSYGVESVGLGFSHNSMSSPLNTLTSMMTKRVLPAMAIYTTFDYLNDTSQDVFGVGITGAIANVIANFDIAGRGLAYRTGIGQGLDWFKQTSVIGEYWTGSTDYQTTEERKEWYREGYSPVRKSRFWSFGSASEFRGTDISFFQPNYLRRIHSDYKDEVLYGGNKEKWAHSIIPTPTHPLSTIRYLMDPYWLEKKHIDDAPTPLTGKMFSEGSFWGAILNPTIGQVIKPQIMLPEIRKRLTGKGHDVRQIVHNINNRIKLKASENDDLLVVNGTDIRNATYIPYGNAVSTVLNIDRFGNAPGVNYMQGVQDLNDYRTPDGSTYTIRTGSNIQTYSVETNRLVDNSLTQELFKQNEGLGKQLISDINNAIKNKGRGRRGGSNYSSPVPDADREGTYVYTNMVNEYNTYVANYYSDKLDPSMVDKRIGADLARDAMHSVKQLSGIYGFLGEQAFGSDAYTLRYENFGSVSSFSRGFWDAGLGGLGGDFMEIARRFFPSQDRSRVDYNPLRNNAPDWLPEKFHTGVLWTKVTKGEMRLPGAGYEKLNELHPDQFAYDGYGAYDRFKILADVAPGSKEYKIWRNIAKHTIQDPDLKEDMKEIEARTKRMSGSHEFYNYQYLNSNTSYETGIVKQIQQDGTVLLANNQVLSLAGIEFNDNYNGELSNFLRPGQKITYRTTDDAINDLNEGVIRNAAIFKGSDNINRALIDLGVADRDITDTSSIGQLATVSAYQEVLGAVQEVIAHARIPIVHNKFMHIESPLESFISEQVNGANFQTWDHPIQGFIMPLLNETAGQSILRRAAAVGYSRFHFNKVLNMDDTKLTNKFKKFGSGVALATLDPSAMLFGTANWVLHGMSNGRSGDGSEVLGSWSKGAKFGSAVGTAYWAYQNADNPLKAAVSFGALGYDLFNRYEFGEFAEKVLNKSMDWKYGAAIGAGIGLAVSAFKNPNFDKDRMFGKHIPKKYQKINDLNEYFDRLEYIKYKGLYEDAARKAAMFEGTAVKDIFKQLDKNKAKISKLNAKARKLLDKYNEKDPEYISKLNAINKEISGLKEAGNHMFKGGKYTKSAVAYKKAMESTIYGMSDMATQDEILAAVPDQYKDYFQEFMKVTDKSEQKKILSYLPDYLKRPLQAAWGQKLEDIQSNRKYFKSHKLPNFTWRGWKPNINLRHVQMKTIENEGMLLADFGFYDSEKAKAHYTMAPDIENYNQASSGIGTLLNLGAELRGFGVITSNVSLEHTSAPGLWITSDIKQNIENRTEIASQSMTSAIQGICATLF